MSKPRSYRRATALGLGFAAALSAAALPLLTTSASADTAGIPATLTTTASSPTQANLRPVGEAVAPQGPFINLSGTANTAITINTTAAAGTNNGFEIRLCNNTQTISNNAQFVPLQGKNCTVPNASATSSTFLAGFSDYSGVVSPDGTLTTATYTMNVGPGTQTYNTPTGPATVTCDSANPCTLWIKNQIGVGTYFEHWNLNFDPPPGVPATPAAPTVTLTGPGNTAHIVWSAPAAFPAIDDYLVTPYIGGVAQAPIDTLSTATTLDLPGLTNFSSYTYTVTAHNSLGNGPASPQSAPPVVPTPAAGAAPSATSSAASSATVTFGALAGATNYVVTPFDVTTATAGAPVTVGASPASFTTLNNGDTYTFTYHALYGANAGPESPASAPIKIGSHSVSQVLIASRPVGTLDIAESCANGFTGATYNAASAPPINPPYTTSYTGATANPAAAAGPQFGLYPQTCDVDLGTGALNANATYYDTAIANLNTVSVRDLRDGDLGWSVSTQLTDFTGISPGPATFNGDCLEFTPRYTELSNVAAPVYQQKVHVPGDTANDALAADTGALIGGTCVAGTGINNATVQTAAATGGLGVANLDATLRLHIPVSVKADTYVATLTFTVIGN